MERLRIHYLRRLCFRFRDSDRAVSADRLTKAAREQSPGKVFFPHAAGTRHLEYVHPVESAGIFNRWSITRDFFATFQSEDRSRNLEFVSRMVLGSDYFHCPLLVLCGFAGKIGGKFMGDD